MNCPGQADCTIDREAELRLIETVASHAAAEWVAQLHVYAPQLIHLMDEAYDRPMRAFTPQVRQLICEYEHFDDCGDTCSHDPATLEAHVKLLIECLEELHRDRMKRESWHAMPAAPPMFG